MNLKKIALTSALTTVLIAAGCSGGGQTSVLSVDEVSQPSEKTASSIIYSVDSEASTFEWIGRKIAGSHNGFITISEGEIAWNDETSMIEAGNFTIDMNSITVADIGGAPGESLVNHLKDDDFFGSATHPTATFEIVKIENSIVTGNLTIKGITKTIEFPATITVNEENITAEAEFDVDRTEFDVRYGSGKFFEDIGDSAIDDNFGVKLKLTAVKQ